MFCKLHESYNIKSYNADKAVFNSSLLDITAVNIFVINIPISHYF